VSDGDVERPDLFFDVSVLSWNLFCPTGKKLGADRPWGVQLAAGFNRDIALASYARAMTRLRGVIGDQDRSLLGSVLRSRGTRIFYQVRIGADTRPEADDLCNRIRRTGGACFVLRNRV
jgi:hypothetical protein